MKEYLNFTVGPVQSPECVKQIGAEDCPYFRTNEFSRLMLENESLVLEFINAPSGSHVVFLTTSGTGGMEATVMNVLTPADHAIVINGGSFGLRFKEMLELHDIKHDEIRLKYGSQLTENVFSSLSPSSIPYSALLVNKHETSTGILYNMQLIADFCREYNLLLIVDAISSFLADSFDMSDLGADVVIVGSQKALACPPGVTILVLSPKAISRISGNHSKCMYMDLKDALRNQERGQTPFTPAVGTLLQINARLREIQASGGVSSEIEKVEKLAKDFRQRIKDYPVKIFSESLSNAVTPLAPTNGMSAYEIFLRLKDEYHIWVCPNGGGA